MTGDEPLDVLELTWFQLPAFMIGCSYACDEPRRSWVDLISSTEFMIGHSHAGDERIHSWVDLISSTWVYDWSQSCRWWAYTLLSWLDFKYWVYDWSRSCRWWAYTLSNWVDFNCQLLWLVTVMHVMNLDVLDYTWFQLPVFMIGHSYDRWWTSRCSWVDLISIASVYDWSQLCMWWA